jgi:hypothetical protein
MNKYLVVCVFLLLMLSMAATGYQAALINCFGGPGYTIETTLPA